jgi:carboxylate-amine ligase
MRELVRREPTFGLHVHVGVPDPEDAIRLANRLRDHLPLLLALSANSPFWQGRDTGLASTRTPLFQAFPRTGTPRPFSDYAEWVETVDLLIRCQAFPEPTHLWWDVRPQPRFGTVEVRIMDAQTEPWQTGALAALLQCLSRVELEDPPREQAHPSTPEVIGENRFLAARDGVEARLIDLDAERRVPVRDLVERLVERCEPHAQALGCSEELALVRRIAAQGGARNQLALAAEGDGLPDLVRALSQRFSPVDRAGAAAGRA